MKRTALLEPQDAGRGAVAVHLGAEESVGCRRRISHGRKGGGTVIAHHEHPNATLVREGFEAFQKGDMAWMDQHLADDIVWHVGGNSKWAGSYEGKANVLDFFARQTQALAGPPSADIHDILGSDDHVAVLGTATASAPDGSSAEWKYVQVFHIEEGKAKEVWGFAENDAAVDPFLDRLPG